MRISIKNSVLILVALGSVTACSFNRQPKFDDAQYWQRKHASELVYTRGPKAQQMLNRDLAHCVSEIRELTRLGSLRQGRITENSTRIQDPDMRELRKWEDPERDEYMFAEHSNYYDLEGCMLASGWERIKYVPYDVAKQGGKDYVHAHVDYEYQKRKRVDARQDHENMDLNE